MKHMRPFHRSGEVNLLVQRVPHKGRAQLWVFVWRIAAFLFSRGRVELRREEREADEALCHSLVPGDVTCPQGPALL